MKLDHLLLGLLAMGPRSGYDVVKYMQREGRYLRSNTDPSQVYRVLSRMLTNGWLTQVTESRDGAPDAKVYRLSDQGRRELLAWARSPYVPPSRFSDPDFMVRFEFGGMVDPEGLRQLVVTELAARRREVAANRGRDRTRTYTDPIPEVDSERGNLLSEMAHRFGMRGIDAWISWLEETLAELDNRGVTHPRDAEGDAALTAVA